MNYTVHVTSKLIETAEFSVDAETEDEAKDKAEALTDDPNVTGWEFYDHDCTFEVE